MFPDDAGRGGKHVTDIHGNAVAPVVTDGNGKYLFENLPVLAAGQSYTVRIDLAKSQTALKGLVPTKARQGDRIGDSDDWAASSQGLTLNGEQDLTLDFGFIVRPADPKPGMPNTGF